MRDGAHTHHDPGSGLALAVVAAIVVAACSGAIAAAITALIHLLLIVLGVLAALAIAGGFLTAAVTRHRRHTSEHWLMTARADALPAMPAAQALPSGSPGIGAMQTRLDQLTWQVAAITSGASQVQGANVPAETHLYLHGIDTAQALRAIETRSGHDR